MKGIVLTHGHEDHIGGLPYLLSRVNIPIYGTPLTLGLVGNKLKEHSLFNKAKLNVVNAGDTIRLGCMEVKFIHVNHSIPDAVAFAIRTPAGTLVHTGDFKIDCTPILGDAIDFSSFAQAGDEGVLALLAESTNASRPGFTRTERLVSDSLNMLFNNAANYRIIIATFASNVNRVQPHYHRDLRVECQPRPADHRLRREVRQKGRLLGQKHGQLHGRSQEARLP